MEIFRTFVDWRPVSSVPIDLKVLFCRNWKSFKTANPFEPILDGDVKNLAEVQYRFCCRNDGLMLFQIKTNKIEDRILLEIAREVSLAIKKHSRHIDIVGAPTADVSILTPIVCQQVNIEEFKEFKELAMDTDALKALKAYSVYKDRVSGDAAILAIKRQYSRLFDQKCMDVQKIKRQTKNPTDLPRFRKLRAYIYGVPISIFMVAIVSLVTSNALQLGFDKQIIISSVFVTAIALAFIFLFYNVLELIRIEISIYSRMILRLAQGNTLIRVLRKHYKDSLGLDEFDPAIKIAENQIASAQRRQSRIIFYFSIATAVASLYVATISLT